MAVFRESNSRIFNAGLLIKRWCTKPRRAVGMKSAKWVKYPLAFFMIISGASVAYFLWSIKRKFSCCTQKDPRNDKLDVNLKLNPKRVWKEKRRGNYSEAGSYSHVIPPGVWVWRHPGGILTWSGRKETTKKVGNRYRRIVAGETATAKRFRTLTA